MLNIKNLYQIYLGEKSKKNQLPITNSTLELSFWLSRNITTSNKGSLIIRKEDVYFSQ